MKYSCEVVSDLLPLYHDGTASGASTKIVEEHLAECDECRRLYQEMKKTADMKFQPSSMADSQGGYLSLAKRLRRTKWYWRLCIGLLVGCVVTLSLMYSDGNRFDPLRAAYASNIVDAHLKPLATVPMGGERVLYIFDDDGLYREIDATYRFPYWKYTYVWPNKTIADPNSGVQMVTKKAYGNSIAKSFYIVCAVAVNDERVAYIELGKEGSLQRQDTDSSMTVFYWDETGNWDGTGTWDGMITDSELRGTAYADDGTVLYTLALVHETNGQDAFKWIPSFPASR